MPLGSPSWDFLGLLRLSWEASGPKNLKKHEGFLRFLKRLFEAPDGPLGLILAPSWAVFGQKVGPKRV